MTIASASTCAGFASVSVTFMRTFPVLSVEIHS
jgi:hypothetical protein